MKKYLCILVLILGFILLLKIKEKFIQKKRIIIIGNSPKILEFKRGKEIDKFDKIVRFNTFDIKNFEEYVGTKTNIWFINGLTVRKKYKKLMDKLKKVKCNEIYAETNTYDTKERLSKANPTILKIKNFKFMDINIFKDTQKIYNPRGFNPHSSLGLRGIYQIAETYPNYEIYIYGFDNFSSNKIHYMDELKNDKKVHNTELEKKFMNYLIKKYNLKKF